MHRIPLGFYLSCVLPMLASCTGATNSLDSAPLIDTDTATDTDTGQTLSVTTISPADSRLRYTGRWNVADPSLPFVGWQGASVSLRFDGTDLEATLDPGSKTEYFRVIIDDDHLGSRRFAAAPGIATYTLAQGLENGNHTIELVKETYMGTNWTLHGFTLTGVDLLNPLHPHHAASHFTATQTSRGIR